MDVKSIGSTFITLIIVLLAVFVLGSIVAGYPAPISYVETDSMQPQLDPNDGFVGIPKPLAGEVSTGDVVTYRAKRIGGGGLTTHRVIDRTNEGYITRGDNNPFNDTAAGEPPVKPGQIELVAVQYQGELIVIENAGDATLAIQSVLKAVLTTIGVGNITATNPGVLVTVVGFILVVGGGAYDAVTADNKRSMSRSIGDRSRVDSRFVFIGLLIAVSLPLLSVMALPSGTTDMGILAADTPDPDDPRQAAPGNFSQSNISFENTQPVPLIIVVDPVSDGIKVYDRILFAKSGETVDSEVRVYAPEQNGWAVRVRSSHYYIPLLPQKIIYQLHSIHPLIALTAVMSVVWIPTGFVYWLTVGFGYIKLRDVS